MKWKDLTKEDKQTLAKDIASYVNPHLLPRVDLMTQRNKLPNSPGIYFVIAGKEDKSSVRRSVIAIGYCKRKQRISQSQSTLKDYWNSNEDTESMIWAYTQKGGRDIAYLDWSEEGYFEGEEEVPSPNLIQMVSHLLERRYVNQSLAMTNRVSTRRISVYLPDFIEAQLNEICGKDSEKNALIVDLLESILLSPGGRVLLEAAAQDKKTPTQGLRKVLDFLNLSSLSRATENLSLTQLVSGK